MRISSASPHPTSGSAWRFAASAVLVAASALIVFHLRIGGVVATLTPHHGIHAGDPLGFLAFAGGVALFDRRSLRRAVRALGAVPTPRS